MKKTDKPSMYFVGAILRAFDKAEAEGSAVTCSTMWTYICMETFPTQGGFTALFAWDTSKAKSKNRIRTIDECIRRGHVPGLVVDDRLRVERQNDNQKRSKYLCELSAFMASHYPDIYEGHYEQEGQGPDLDDYVKFRYPERAREVFREFGAIG